MKFNNYIALYIRKLTGESTTKLDDWLSNKDHQEYTDGLKKAWNHSASYQNDFEPNVDKAFSKFKNRIDAESTTAKVVEMPLRRRWLSIAASVAVIVGVGLLANNYLSNQVAWETASTHMGETQKLNLSDGSTIVLNEGSRLTYPTTFDASKRSVKLEGEAFFEIAKNPNKPFTIETAHTTTTILGTSFNIRAYNSDNYTEIQVATGKVSFSPTISEKELTLSAGQEGIFNHTTNVLKPEKKSTLNGLSWLNQKLSFKKTPLHRVISDLERHFSIQIELENKAIENCEYISLFNNPDKEVILETLSSAFELELVQTSTDNYQLKGGSCY